jgi:YegS/Rv2252/BmrU family lipid kinase
VRVLLAVNPNSRRGRRFGEAAREELRRLGVEAVAHHDDGPIDAIVAAGGDGTFARQIGRALHMKVPIGLIPLGTFNDLARTVGVPQDVAGACAVIAAGRTRAIDVARVNDAYYVNEASMGISSRIARLQTPEDKQRFGALAVVATAFAALRVWRPFNAEIAFDGRRERVRAVQLTVANSHRFGGVISVESAAIDDGRLDLYAVDIDTFGQALAVLGAILAGRGRPTAGLRTYRAASFEVSTHRPHRITADGEPAGQTPARFELLPQALRIFVP